MSYKIIFNKYKKYMLALSRTKLINPILERYIPVAEMSAKTAF